MIVEPTPHNQKIYKRLCDIDVAYTLAESQETRERLIAEALQICEEIEVI